MEITGTIYKVNETQVISDRFKKREVIIMTEASTPYPQYLPCVVTQDKVGLLDKFKKGDEVKAQINLKGKIWNGGEGERFFSTIEIWRIELLSNTGVTNPSNMNTGENSINTTLNNDSDLPF